MRSIELDSGIKEIEVKNKRGIVQTVIRVDVNDVDGMKKIASVITDLRNLSAECQAEVERKKQECREMDKYQMAVVASELRIKYLDKVIGRIDGIFGADTVKNVFTENYRKNPDYTPDEFALIDLLDKLLPEVAKLYEEKFAENRKKYNITRRAESDGSHV